MHDSGPFWRGTIVLLGPLMTSRGRIRAVETCLPVRHGSRHSQFVKTPAEAAGLRLALRARFSAGYVASLPRAVPSAHWMRDLLRAGFMRPKIKRKSWQELRGFKSIGLDA